MSLSQTTIKRLDDSNEDAEVIHSKFALGADGRCHTMSALHEIALNTM